MKKFGPIFLVRQRPVSQKNLTHLREASIFILRYLYQSLLQFSGDPDADPVFFLHSS